MYVIHPSSEINIIASKFFRGCYPSGFGHYNSSVRDHEMHKTSPSSIPESNQ